VFGGGADCIGSSSSTGLGAGLGAFGASSSYGLIASFGLGPELSRRTSTSALLHVASTLGISGSKLEAYLNSDTVQNFDDDFCRVPRNGVPMARPIYLSLAICRASP
jgi:hypothetical protein